MHIYIHTYIHIYTNTHTHTHIHTYIGWVVFRDADRREVEELCKESEESEPTAEPAVTAQGKSYSFYSCMRP